MLRVTFVLTMLCPLLGGGGAFPLHAQDDAQDETTRSRPAASRQVEEAKLRTYYLLRENGELAPYFEVPFEEFEAIYRLYRGIDEGERPSRYSVSEISLQGTVVGDVARLEAKISLRATVDGWVRVPIRLDDCQLRAPQSKLEGAEAFLAVDEDGEGLVCWLDGQAGQQVELTLNFVRQIESDLGGQRRLQLKLPEAAFSQLQLEVPLADANGAPRDDATIQETTHPTPQSTRFTVLGRPGGFDFSWGPRNVAAEDSLRLMVTSETEVLVESDRQARWQSRLSVERSVGMLESFEVLLPPGATLLPNDATGYTLEPLPPLMSPAAAGERVGEGDSRGEAADAEGLPDAAVVPDTEGQASEPSGGENLLRPRVRVRLLRPAARVDDVVIATRLVWPAINASEFHPLRGLEVLDAARHVGQVELFASSREWVVDWELEQGLSRAPTPSSSELGGLPVAGFTFARQDYRFGLRSERQPTRINVEPVVTLFASRSAVRLEAHCRLALSGSPINRLVIDRGGWELETITAGDAVGTSGIIRAYEVNPDNEQQYLVYLDPQASAEQNTLILRLTGRRLLEPGKSEVRLAFPQIEESTVASTTLLIRQEESLVLRPERNALQSVPAGAIPEWYRPTLAEAPDAIYRGLLKEERGPLKFTISVRPRSVSYRSLLQARVFARRLEVSSQIELDIKHQSLREVQLLVPTDLLRDSDLIVRTAEDQEWIWTWADIAVDRDSPMTVLPLEFSQGQLGRLILDLSYRTRIEESVGPAAAGEGARDGNPTPANGQAPIPLRVPMVQVLLPKASPGDEETPSTWIAKMARWGTDWVRQFQPRFIEVEFQHPLDSEVEPPSDAWEQLGVVPAAGDLKSSFTTAQPHPAGWLDFELRRHLERDGFAVSVEKCWLQTQLTPDARQDRAVFAVRTRQAELTLQLPAGATLTRLAVDQVALRRPRIDRVGGRQQVRVAMDWDQVGGDSPARLSDPPATRQTSERSENRTPAAGEQMTSERAVPGSNKRSRKSEGESERLRVIEVWYRFAEREPQRWPAQIEWPQLEGVQWIDRTYWQLITPRDEHLAWFDARLAAEHQWGFGPVLFERQARRSQEELEEWSGAEPQLDATRGSNVYLFSRVGQPQMIQFATVQRWVVLAFAGGLTFLLGVVVTYSRSLRRPVVLLTVGGVIGGLALLQLELAVLAAQVALLGMLFVAATAFLKWLLGQSRPAPSVAAPIDSDAGSAISRGTRTAAREVAPAAPDEVLVVSSSHAET